MIDSQWFSFSFTPLMTAFAIVLVIAGAIVSGLALKRAGFKRSQCVLEALRFLLICAVALVACQPCLLYTSPSPRDLSTSRMPSSA